MHRVAFLPQRNQHDVPSGKSIINLVETAAVCHLEAAHLASRVDDVRYHLLKFIQLLVDVFFWDMRARGSDLRDPSVTKEAGDKPSSVDRSASGGEEDRRVIFNANG